MTQPLSQLNEAELQRLARVAERMFAGRPRLTPGNQPHRLRAGHGIEFLDYRDYQPGDSLREIDWLASARSRRPQVRRFRNETSSDWYLCLDDSASMGLQPGKWALAVQLAAALAYLLIHLDNRVSVLLFSDRIDGLKPMGRGQRAYAGILHLLAEKTPRVRGGDSILRSCIPYLASGCQFFVISDFLKARGMRQDLALMASIGEATHAIQVLDPADASLETMGSSTLVDVESGNSYLFDIVPEANDQAAAKVAELTTGIHSHCRRQRISFSSCNTSQHWREVLVGHLFQPGQGLA